MTSNYLFQQIDILKMILSLFTSQSHVKELQQEEINDEFTAYLSVLFSSASSIPTQAMTYITVNFIGFINI